MANVRGGIGSLSWGIVPVNWDSSNLATMSWDYRNNFLKSANDQLRYQVQWNAPGINEGSPLTQEGDLINVIFTVETSVDGTHWNTIGKIKKSRDIANKRFETGTQPNGHRFTIDISQLVSDQLSYSLCPINKGTWQSNYYGGMNGGLTMQDNVIGSQMSAGNPISNYNVSENGTFRRVRVSATFEILDADSQVITASDTLSYPPYLTVINSVNQYERDDVYYNKYNVDYRTGYEFLTRCPNLSYGSVVQDFKKPVRIDEQAEWLQFYMRIGWSFEISGSGATLNDKVCAMGIKISTYIGDSLENTFYLNDFQQNIIESTFGGFSVVDNYQNQMFIQNISPYYINNTAALKTPNSPPSIGRSTTGIADNWSDYTGDKITANTTRYTANLVKVSLYSPYVVLEVSHSYNYTIDRESANIPYGYVRFHWLNSLGAIDSYTAKRDVVEGLTISRDVIERKSGDRTWYQANSGAVNGSEQNVNPNSSYISDTMRGGDIYKGGREVSSINADRVESVYTEPLNKSVAKWLEEMILSPNVWIEKDTDATARGNSSNPYLRPSTKGYIPVIITNSDIETVNQSEGLVKFNIEYTLAHKVQTQRN
tara:strand:- start:303 stop:2093 length:1791 start_codon:yes stop_codon:yes gene_type:complete